MEACLRAVFAFLGAALLLLSAGCTAFRYVPQAACGQIDVMIRARPIEEAIGDSEMPPRVARLLSEVAEIKHFGERYGLTPTGSYETYADLGREEVVWVVSAAEQLSFRQKTWTFPIAGTVPYLGWFELAHAKDLADELDREGWDVHLRQASAYSTLGWFRDPILSTMIPEGDDALGELVNVILHESVHATVYIEGQTLLNESLANFVAERLTVAFLSERLGPLSIEKSAYLLSQARRKRQRLAMQRAYKTLSDLYTSDRDDQEKLAEKQRVLHRLEAEIGTRRKINNATLAQSKAYNSGQTELSNLLLACGGSYPRLLSALKSLEQKRGDRPYRDVGEILRPLLARGCEAGASP